jgi:hypothetical protein
VPGSSYSSLSCSFQLSSPNPCMHSLLRHACHVPTNFCRHPRNVCQVILTNQSCSHRSLCVFHNLNFKL